MEIVSWRIAKKKYAQDHIFSGLGAEKYGGRWNSIGTPLIYTSEHISTACLENLVHSKSKKLINKHYVLYRCCFDDSIALYLDATILPDDWRSGVPTPITQNIGDQWVEENQSAVLIVPSVVIPQEHNCLLNPNHKDFNEIEINGPETFLFDPRLN